MKKSNRTGYKGNSWKELQNIMGRGGSRDRIFSDWLDLMLSSALALTDNVQRGNIKLGKFDGKYEEQYLEIVGRYDNTGKKGTRPIDHFAAAYGLLLKEMEETGKDCLGEIYMSEITYGEHGQFYTPETITDFMAQIITTPSKSEDGREVVCDPCCGSGRMLLSAHKTKPDAFLVGIDLDPRCAKMCALNLIFKELEGDVYCGNSLTGKMEHVWMVRRGWVQEQANPETPERMQKYAEEQKQLSLHLAA